MRYYNFIRLILQIVWRPYCTYTDDKGKNRKYRMSFKTAWNVSYGIWLKRS